MCISDIVYCTNSTKVKVLLRLKEQSSRLMVRVLLTRARVTDGFENSEMETLIWSNQNHSSDKPRSGRPQKVNDTELQELLHSTTATCRKIRHYSASYFWKITSIGANSKTRKVGASWTDPRATWETSWHVSLISVKTKEEEFSVETGNWWRKVDSFWEP